MPAETQPPHPSTFLELRDNDEIYSTHFYIIFDCFCSLSEFQSTNCFLKSIVTGRNIRNEPCFAISSKLILQKKCKFTISVMNMPLFSIFLLYQGVNNIPKNT